LILAIVGLIQFPLFVAFPVVYFIISRKILFKEFGKMFLSSLIFFIILFLPNLINFGFLTQAEKSNWGYLIVNNFDSFLVDFWALLLFLLIIALPYLFESLKLDGFSNKINSYKIKLLIFVILGILVQFFITYRWNVFNAIVFAVLLIEVLPKKVFEEKVFTRLMSLIIFIIVLNGFVPLFSANLSNVNLLSYDYLKMNTSSSDKILNDPLFGHDIAFFADRKIMADLVVEYAPEQQLLDTYNFLEEKNYDQITNYDIDWVFNQPYMINRKSTGNEFLQTTLEFELIDKVYDNEHFVVHYVGNNLIEN
jgi:hypothetical protein